MQCSNLNRITHGRKVCVRAMKEDDSIMCPSFVSHKTYTLRMYLPFMPHGINSEWHVQSINFAYVFVGCIYVYDFDIKGRSSTVRGMYGPFILHISSKDAYMHMISI